MGSISAVLIPRRFHHEILQNLDFLAGWAQLRILSCLLQRLVWTSQSPHLGSWYEERHGERHLLESDNFVKIWKNCFLFYRWSTFRSSWSASTSAWAWTSSPVSEGLRDCDVAARNRRRSCRLWVSVVDVLQLLDLRCRLLHTWVFSWDIFRSRISVLLILLFIFEWKIRSYLATTAANSCSEDHAPYRSLTCGSIWITVSIRNITDGRATSTSTATSTSRAMRSAAFRITSIHLYQLKMLKSSGILSRGLSKVFEQLKFSAEIDKLKWDSKITKTRKRFLSINLSRITHEPK